MSKKTAYARQTPFSVSQNFLTSTRTIDRLLALTTITKDDAVWEIGTGKGHITRRLLWRCGHLTSVEIDPKFAENLKAQFDGTSTLRLVHGDFLQTPLPTRTPYKVFANIPFCKTTEIVRKLTTARNPPQDCWLIMEKGAAKRFAGKPCENVHSLSIKPFFDVRIAYYLRREDFHPMPSVDTVLVHFARKAVPDIAPYQRRDMEAFIRAMIPCLQGGHGRGPMSRHEVMAALRRGGFEKIPPSATLRYVQWLCLFRWWTRSSPQRTRRNG